MEGDNAAHFLADVARALDVHQTKSIERTLAWQYDRQR